MSCFFADLLSAFFRDMPEHSWELSGTSEKLIHLDATPEHFAKLLKFLYTHPKFDWPDLHIVAELGARLQFEILPDIIVGAAIALLRAGNESGAFGMFEYAAQNDKPHLAKIAIASFGSTSFGKRGGVSEIDYALFTHIPGSYTAALLKGMASHFIGGKRNWSPVSDSFHVK